MFDPAQLVDIARALLDLGDAEDEHYHRSVLNRCYYATYGTIRRELERADPGLFSRKGQHATLVITLSESDDPHVKRIGARLHRLKTSRELADYEFDRPTVQDEARVATELAPRAIDKISKLSQAQWERITNAARTRFR